MTSNRRKGEIKRSQFWNKWNTSFFPEGSIGVSTGDLAADPVQSSLLAEFQCFVVCDVMAIYNWTIRAIWYEFSKGKRWDQHYNSYVINIRESDCQCVDDKITHDFCYIDFIHINYLAESVRWCFVSHNLHMSLFYSFH